MKAKLMLFAALMLVPVVFAVPGQGAPNCGVTDNYSVTLQSVVPLGNGNYNWTYQVCQLTGKTVSHWVLQTCNCTNFYGDRSTSCMTDPSTNLYGLKFDVSFNGCRTFWFVADKDYNNASINAGVKAGDGVCNYTVTGPGCTSCEGPTCGGIPAPEFPSIAVPLIVAAGAATFVYALRKSS